jgi:hypothetical protein
VLIPVARVAIRTFADIRTGGVVGTDSKGEGEDILRPETAFPFLSRLNGKAVLVFKNDLFAYSSC